MDLTQDQLFDEICRQWRDKDYLEVRTSGSTGTPKLIRLTKKHLTRSALRTIKFFNISTESHLHSEMSFKHIGGMMMVVRSLVAGCRLSWSEPSLRPSVPDSRISLMSLVPAQMVHILDHPEEYNVDNFLIGGSAINPNLARRISDSQFSCWESYGMTETATHIAMRPIQVSENGTLPPFQVLDGIKVFCGEDGAINIEDEEVKVFTNDIAEMIEPGKFNIMGRKDHIIVTGGRKVHPLTIEDALAEDFKDLHLAYYIDSTPDEVWTSAITIIIEKSEGLSPYEIIDKAKEKINCVSIDVLPQWMRPKRIIITDKIPKTANGKIIRNNIENVNVLAEF